MVQSGDGEEIEIPTASTESEGDLIGERDSSVAMHPRVPHDSHRPRLQRVRRYRKIRPLAPMREATDRLIIVQRRDSPRRT